MYLFDLYDNIELDCNSIPDDWNDFKGFYRKAFDEYYLCNFRFISDNITNLSPNSATALNLLLFDLNQAITNSKNKLDILIDELNNVQLNCFDRVYYDDFIESFNNISAINQQIATFIKTNGEHIGVDANVGVELINISNQSGSFGKKTYKCDGVYIKQIKSGSEFIGTVTSLNGEIK